MRNPEIITALKEIAPKVLETGERIVISGIESTGKVVECAIKDGKIIEHTARTVQEGIKSGENIALSVISEGGECFKCLVKDGQIVRESAETVRYGIQTTGEIAKQVIHENGETIRSAITTIGSVSSDAIRGIVEVKKIRSETVRSAITTIGSVSSDAIRGIVEVKTIKPKLAAQVRQTEIIIDGQKYLSLIEALKEHPELFAVSAQKEIAIAEIKKDKAIAEKRGRYQGVAEILKTLGDQVERIEPLLAVKKSLLDMSKKVGEVLPSRNDKQLSKVLVSAYGALDSMSQISNPIVDSMRRMLKDAVESKNPVVIDIIVKSIRKEWTHLFSDEIDES